MSVNCGLSELLPCLQSTQNKPWILCDPDQDKSLTKHSY